MSPRSDRSSASLPSNSPALIATPTSSPTPLMVTVTAPPATVPSTVVSASRAWAFCELLLHLLGLLEQGVHVEAARRRGRRRGSGSWSGHFWGRSVVTGAGSPRSSGRRARAGAARRRARPLVSASGSSGWASASASARRGRRSATGRPGLLDRLAGGRAAAAGRRGLARGRRRLGRGSRQSRCGSPRRGAGRGRGRGLAAGSRRGGAAGGCPPGVGLAPGSTIVVDPPVDADHVDGGLAQDLVAAAADEGVAGAGVGEAEGQRVAVDRRRPGSSG